MPARSLGFARLFLDSSCMFLPITCPMDSASGISSLALGLVGCNLWICKGLGKAWRGLVRFTDLWYVRVCPSSLWYFLVHEFVAHSVLGDAWWWRSWWVICSFFTGAAIHRLAGCSSKAPRFHLQGPRTLWKDQGFVTPGDAKSNALHVVSPAPDISQQHQLVTSQYCTRRTGSLRHHCDGGPASGLERDGLKMSEALQSKRREQTPKRFQQRHFFPPLFHYLKEKWRGKTRLTRALLWLCYRLQISTHSSSL